jgi:hypothetical protein
MQSRCFVHEVPAGEQAFQRLKAQYDARSGIGNAGGSERDSIVQEALDRVKNMVQFCYSVPGYRLSIYQRELMRELIVSSLPLIVGRSLWNRQRQMILARMGIVEEQYSTIFFSITGRRMGKTRVCSVFLTGILLFAHLDFGSDLLVALFARNLKGSKRLLECTREIIDIVIDRYSGDISFEANSENIRVRRRGERYTRTATAYPGNGEVSLRRHSR